MFYIYCYENKINGKRYIGKTNNLARRKRRHRRNAFVDNYTLPIYNALRKYGEDGFLFSILDSFNSEDIILDIERILSGKSWKHLNLDLSKLIDVKLKNNHNHLVFNKETK